MENKGEWNGKGGRKRPIGIGKRHGEDEMKYKEEKGKME